MNKLEKKLEECKSLILSHDTFEQGDAFDNVFNAWYDCAKQFAKGSLSRKDMNNCTVKCCNVLLTTHLPTFLTNPNTDDFVVRSLSSNFSKILALHIEKPKFTALLVAQQDETILDLTFVQWLQSIASLKLSQLSGNAGIPVANRIAFLGALSSIQKVETCIRKLLRKQQQQQLDENNSDVSNVDVILDTHMHVPLLLRIATNTTHSSLFRAAAVAGLKQAMRNAKLRCRTASDVKSNVAVGTKCASSSSASSSSTSRQHSGSCDSRESSVCDIVSRFAIVASDSEALSELLSPPFDGIAHERVVENLLRRVAQARATQTESAGASSTSALIASGAPSFTNSLLEALANAINQRVINVKINQEALVRVIESCDCLERVGEASSSTASSPDDPELYERPPLVLDTLAAAIRQHPSSIALLQRALSLPSIETLALLQALCAEFGEEAWLTTLLPWIVTRLDRMGLGGVSGRRFEQEVVDLVRECGRVYYINGDRKPTLELGKLFFNSVVECMRHGYCETERFSPLAASVVRYHAMSNSVDWLVEAFCARVCHNRAVQRMMNDVALRLLGPEACDDADERQAEPALVTAMLAALAQRHTAPAWLLLADLATRRSTLVLLCDSAWLRVALVQVSDLIAAKDTSGDTLDAARDVLLRVAPHVAPALAPALFELLLQLTCAISARSSRTAHLRAPAERRGWLSLGKHSNKSSDGDEFAQQAACDDELLARLVHRISPEAPLALAAINQALSIGGPLTRAALAAFVPIVSLSDPVANVRVAALHQLMTRPDLLLFGEQCDNIAAKVFACVHMTRGGGGHDAASDEALTSDLVLLEAAAPLAALLGVARPKQWLAPALDLLIKAARASAKSDPQSRPHANVLDAIARLAAGCGVGQLAEVAAAGDATFLSSLVDAAALDSGMRTHLNELSGADGVLTARSKKASSSSSALAGTSSNKTTELFSNNKKSKHSHAMPFKLRKNAAQAADTLLNAESPLDLATTALERGDALSAVRLLNRVRARDPVLFESRGRPLLTARALPLLASTKLPARDSDGKFSDQALNEQSFDATVRLLEEVRALFPLEAEQCLQVTARLRDLRLAATQHCINTAGTLAARTFLSRRGLSNDSELIMLLESRHHYPIVPLDEPIDEHVLPSPDSWIDVAPAPPSTDPSITIDDSGRLKPNLIPRKVDYEMI